MKVNKTVKKVGSSVMIGGLTVVVGAGMAVMVVSIYAMEAASMTLSMVRNIKN